MVVYMEEIDPRKPPPNQAATYRPDRYYINQSMPCGMRMERVVPAWKFYLTWLLTFWRVSRRWEKSKAFHVIREPDRW